jgi:hypothetical protein
MWEAWRIHISFALVGAIFVICQALSGGLPADPPAGASTDPGDRSYRGAPRDDTDGRGGITSSTSSGRRMVPAKRVPGSGDGRQLD